MTLCFLVFSTIIIDFGFLNNKDSKIQTLKHSYEDIGHINFIDSSITIFMSTT